jgi:hypothetical protein
LSIRGAGGKYAAAIPQLCVSVRPNALGAVGAPWPPKGMLRANILEGLQMRRAAQRRSACALPYRRWRKAPPVNVDLTHLRFEFRQKLIFTDGSGITFTNANSQLCYFRLS